MMVYISTQAENKLDKSQKLESLQAKHWLLSPDAFGVAMIQGDAATEVFTGLSSWSMFLHLFMLPSPFVTSSLYIDLDKEFIFVLGD